MAAEIPSRVVGLDRARARHGALIDRLWPYLYATDPLGDAVVEALDALPPGASAGALDRALAGDLDVPEPLRALVAEVTELPPWVEPARLERAGRLLFRTGMVGGLALGAKSLLSSYASPAGVKPLAFSGRLENDVTRRLSETARFVAAVCSPGGMRPGGEGIRISLRVRLIHSRVRKLIAHRGGWDYGAWGHPINQHDMLATVLLFSTSWLSGIEAMGASVSEREAEDYIHLWAWGGQVMGVDPELLFHSRGEGERVEAAILETQGAPDEDCRRLSRAFFRPQAPEGTSALQQRLMEQHIRLYGGLVRELLGPELSNGLELPDNFGKYLLGALRVGVGLFERLRTLVPGGEALANHIGDRQWRHMLAEGLRGVEPTYALPERLRSAT